MRDSILNFEVERRIERETGLEGSEINVKTSDGVVTLSGRASSRTTRRTAEQAAQRVPGIKAVTSEVQILPEGSIEPSDDELARAAVAALESEGRFLADRIKVVVSHGWIFLEGVVDLKLEKVAAEEAVRGLKGSRGVSNLLSVMHHGADCTLTRT